MSSPLPPLVAVIPSSPVLDTEEEAAAEVGLPVVRFRFQDDVEIVSFSRRPTKNAPAAAGIFRGFMLTEPRFRKLYTQLLRRHNIRLLTTPEQYAAAHYYPNMLQRSPILRRHAARSKWVHVTDDIDSGDDDDDEDKVEEQKAKRRTVLRDLRREFFIDAAREAVREWSPGFVCLKDAVKSAKPHFLKVPLTSSAADDDEKNQSEAAARHLAEQCVNLVHMREEKTFNRGVVIKEFVPLRVPRNEWRLWFCNGVCVLLDWNGPDDISDSQLHALSVAAASGSEKMIRNAGPPAPPTALVAEISVALRGELGFTSDTFVTVDFAQKEDGGWMVLEMGDGGVSGPAVTTHLPTLWRLLKQHLTQQQQQQQQPLYQVNIHCVAQQTWDSIRAGGSK